MCSKDVFILHKNTTVCLVTNADIKKNVFKVKRSGMSVLIKEQWINISGDMGPGKERNMGVRG